jgi:hypothetical protein
MLTALKSLGENLKSQVSVSSVETLEKLSGYYVHQQDQLKGFEKNPEKLKENPAIIDGWINDIKSLEVSVGDITLFYFSKFKSDSHVLMQVSKQAMTK